MVWLASALTQDKVQPPRDPGGTKVRRTFARRRVSSRVTVSQGADHAANFAADSAAWHRLEVRAVSQGLRSKLLWKQKSRGEKG